MEGRVSTTTTRNVTVRLTRTDLLEAMRARLEELDEVNAVPDDARVFVRVPGGGDWSNTDLTIGEDEDHLVVAWTEREES